MCAHPQSHPHPASSASAGTCACIKASFCLCTCVLRVHVCMCVLGRMLAPAGSECAKGTLCVPVRTKGFLGRGCGLRGTAFNVRGADSCSLLSR